MWPLRGVPVQRLVERAAGADVDAALAGLLYDEVALGDALGRGEHDGLDPPVDNPLLVHVTPLFE